MFVDRLEIDLVPLHFLVQRRAIDAECLGGFLAIPAAGFQSLNDQMSFRFGECRLQRRAAQVSFDVGAVFLIGKHFFRQIRRGDMRRAAQDHGPLDDIYQFANIPNLAIMLMVQLS